MSIKLSTIYNLETQHNNYNTSCSSSLVTEILEQNLHTPMNLSGIDTVLNQYLNKYGLQMPQFSNQSEHKKFTETVTGSIKNLVDLNVSQHKSSGISNLSADKSADNNVKSPQLENKSEIVNQLMTQFKQSLQPNIPPDISVFTNQDKDLNTIHSESDMESKNQYQPFSNLLHGPKSPEPKPKTYDQQVQDLIQQHLQAAINIHKSRDNQITQEKKKASQNIPAAQREIYALHQQLSKANATIQLKNVTIKELKNENEKLKNTLARRNVVTSKSVILESELQAALNQITLLRKENLRLAGLVDRFATK